MIFFSLEMNDKWSFIVVDLIVILWNLVQQTIARKKIEKQILQSAQFLLRFIAVGSAFFIRSLFCKYNFLLCKTMYREKWYLTLPLSWLNRKFSFVHVLSVFSSWRAHYSNRFSRVFWCGAIGWLQIWFFRGEFMWQLINLKKN